MSDDLISASQNKTTNLIRIAGFGSGFIITLIAGLIVMAMNSGVSFDSPDYQNFALSMPFIMLGFFIQTSISIFLSFFTRRTANGLIYFFFALAGTFVGVGAVVNLAIFLS